MESVKRLLGIVAIIGLLAVAFSGCVEEEKAATPKPEPTPSPTETPTITPTPKPEPEDAVKAFVEYYNARNADGLYNLFSSRVKSEHSKEELESQLELAKSFGVKITKWNVESKRVANNTAILKVNMTTYMSGIVDVDTVDFSMVFEDGSWLIDSWPWKTHYNWSEGLKNDERK